MSAKKTPPKLPPPAKCPECGSFLSAYGSTVYKNNIVPKHWPPSGCKVTKGTLIKEGPEMPKTYWAPKIGEAFVDAEGWHAKVTLVARGMVYFTAIHHRYLEETGSLGLYAWWLRYCPYDRVPRYETDRGLSVVTFGSSIKILVEDEAQAGAVAFSLVRGDHKGWDWGDDNDF